LGLCGVSNEDIAADTSVSQCYLGPFYNEILLSVRKGHFPSLSAPFFSTAPENMSVLLEHWHSKYGGIPGFLRDCGVSDATCARLKENSSQRTGRSDAAAKHRLK
jgi:hypothetical protein